MTEKRFHYHIDEVGIYYYICDGGKTEDKIFAEVIGDVKEVTDKLNELAEENKKLKQENESLNSQLIRLDKELFCQDCLTCRHSKSIDITVRCANGNGITDYQMNCDFYEIDEEWVE